MPRNWASAEVNVIYVIGPMGKVQGFGPVEVQEIATRSRKYGTSVVAKCFAPHVQRLAR